MTPAGDPYSALTAHLMERFNAAFLEYAPEELDDLVADDCVIENTPSPHRTAIGTSARQPASMAEHCLKSWSAL